MMVRLVMIAVGLLVMGSHMAVAQLTSGVQPLTSGVQQSQSGVATQAQPRQVAPSSPTPPPYGLPNPSAQPAAPLAARPSPTTPASPTP
jgi:X-X-X-Leu-X-X-Gly heptad repeat protein